MKALPSLIGGASEWTRKLEAITTWQSITIGDIKALLGRSIGAKTNEVFVGVGLPEITLQVDVHDWVHLNPYRQLIWDSMRKIFPR